MTERKLRFASALTADGWRDDVVVGIDAAGRIVAIGSGAEAPAAPVIAGHAIPGMANLHSHAHQRAMAGLAEVAGPAADSFWTWREAMYGFALKMTAEDLEAVAAQLYVEMLKAGFTTVGEFQYLHHQPDGAAYDDPAELSLRCLAAAETAGIAITMLPVLYSFGGFGGQPAQAGQRRFVNGPDRFLAILDRLEQATRGRDLRRLGVAPHSLRAVTKEVLSPVLNGIESNSPVHIHVAEQVKEVEDCLAFCGKRPVELLYDSFPVDARWCLIHATHTTPEETGRMAGSGAVAGLCPTTEANLGDGIFAAPEFVAAGGTFGIGSDSHIEVSVAGDLRMLEYSQRLKLRARNVLAAGPGRSTGRSLFEAALAGGVRALAQGPRGLAVGERADIVVLDADHPALIGRRGDAALDSWIFSGGNGCVRDVFVAGRAVVRDRRHAEEDAITSRFRAALARLAN